MSDYITLRSSDGATDKRFWAVSLERTCRRAQTVEELTGGHLSISSGQARDHYHYTLFVPVQPGLPEFGSVADLRRLYSLRNPVATPSDIITLVGHDGEARECRVLGDLPEAPQTVLVENAGAYYAVEIELVDVSWYGLRFSHAAQSAYLPLI